MEKPSLCIGVDPDTTKFGIAVFELGKLQYLYNWKLVNLINYLEPWLNGDKHTGQKRRPHFVIENVMAQNFVYSRNIHKSKAVEKNIALKVGRCQQAQLEFMRILDHYECPYTLIKPTKGNWANNKAMFERITGWQGKSNPETRSAAYFGYMGGRFGHAT